MSSFIIVSTGFAANSIGVREQRGIEYARVGDLSLRLDASIPPGSGPFPAAIIVHGGGWVRGDRRTYVEPLFKPLTDAGIAWFSVDYRLTNDIAQFGAGIDDVQAAIRFVKAHAAEYRIDPNRLAMIGESAGGQVAAMAVLGGAPDLHVKAVVALYTPLDLMSIARNSKMVPEWIRSSVQGTPWEAVILARLKQLSPIEYVRRDMPPFLFIHGTADTLVPFEQSRAMCDRMKAAGVGCELYPVKGGGHGIRWWEQVPGLSEPYKREMVRWLKQQF